MASFLLHPILRVAVTSATVFGGLAGQIAVLNGRSSVRTSLGSTTLLAPVANDDGSAFIVEDQDGLASTNPITLSGNGRLIDGAASIVLDVPNVTASFVLDGGEWRRVEVLRAFDDDQPVASFERIEDLSNALSQESIVPNIAALALSDDTEPSGTRRFVQTLRCNWLLDRTSVAVADGITVIASASGFRWLRQLDPHPVWTAQLAWEYSTAGTLEASGVPGSPVASVAEIFRRLRRVDTSPYVITLLSPVAAADRARLTMDYTMAGAIDGTSFTFLGARTVLFSGAFTATSATVPATNSQATVTDVTMGWAANLGRHVVMTSGPALGATSVVLRDLGAGVARVSEWIFEATGIFSATPIPADTFNVVSETSWAAPLQLQGTDTVKTVVVFDKCQIDTTLVTPRAIDLRFVGCRFVNAINVPLLGGIECLFTGCAWFFAAVTRFLFAVVGRVDCTGGGAVNARFETLAFGSLRMNRLVINGGNVRTHVSVNPGPGGQILVPTGNNLGIFDSPAGEPAILLHRGTMMSIQGTLYGSGNATYGAVVKNNGRLMIATGITPTITGTSGDVQLDEAATAMPSLEPAAGLVLPALSALTTWAHWAAAPFSRNVMSYKTGSAITNLN